MLPVGLVKETRQYFAIDIHCLVRRSNQIDFDKLMSYLVAHLSN